MYFNVGFDKPSCKHDLKYWVGEDRRVSGNECRGARAVCASPTSLSSNVEHKSEVTRHPPCQLPPHRDKTPNCFLAPGGRRPRFALKRRFKLHLWIALFTVLEIGVANCFSTPRARFVLWPSYVRIFRSIFSRANYRSLVEATRWHW